MSIPNKLWQIFVLIVAPAAGFAHPGHFDDAPLAHDVAHVIPYVLLLIAAGAYALQQLNRIRREKSRRKRQP